VDDLHDTGGFDDEKPRPGRLLSDSERAESIERHLIWLNGRMPSDVYKMEEREFSIPFKMKLKYAHRRLQYKLKGYRIGKEGKQ
jgi:hypothetical protein